MELWHWLEQEIGNQDRSFEINQSALAEEFDVSRKSIQNALKTFISANLLKKVESRTGRGNHPLYRLIWTFREETSKSATPSRVECNPQEKSINNGRFYRYHAMKFREAVESSSLAEHAYKIVGKILKFLTDKPPELFKSWLTHLKRWLNGSPREKSLRDFFVFFHDGLMEIARSQMEVQRTERKIQEQREQRKEVQSEYQDNPPPKSSNFARFSDYLDAMAQWDG